MAPKSIVKKAQTEIAPLAAWEQELANEAKADRAKEVLGVPRITHSGGRLQVDGREVTGGTLKLAVIDYCASKAYYEGSYVAGKAQTPACYAFGSDQQGMTPHPAAPKKQAESCDQCPHNVFGTALINGKPGGKGKRCKDERRLMVVMGNTDPNAINGAEVRQLSVPPASLKAWGTYLTAVTDITPLGVRGVITQVGTQSLKQGYGLTFTATDKLAREFVHALINRRESVKPLMMAPYPTVGQDDEPDPKKTAARSKKLA
jgi:hypothetical protein